MYMDSHLIHNLLFWFLSFITLTGAFGLFLMKNPLYSALCLVLSMIGVSALFFTLGASFLAAVQLLVYAGAVMVLFIMVLMLFNLKKEETKLSGNSISVGFKFLTVFLLLSILAVVFYFTPWETPSLGELSLAEQNENTTRKLGTMLFQKYVLGFEALGLLLLMVAVGAVSLARSKGGTHDT